MLLIELVNEANEMKQLYLNFTQHFILFTRKGKLFIENYVLMLSLRK